MKIIFDIGEYDFIEFETKEEYDAHPHSQAGYERYHRRPWGTRNGACYRFFNEPRKFPCIHIKTGILDNPNGPYEIQGMWIYDYTKDEE